MEFKDNEERKFVLFHIVCKQSASLSNLSLDRIKDVLKEEEEWDKEEFEELKQEDLEKEIERQEQQKQKSASQPSVQPEPAQNKLQKQMTKNKEESSKDYEQEQEELEHSVRVENNDVGGGGFTEVPPESRQENENLKQQDDSYA